MGRSKRKVKAKSQKFNNYSLLAIIIISVVTFLAYSNTFDVPFQFDDQSNIVKNQKITNFDNFGKLSYWTNVNNRPLAYLTIAINYAIGGLNTKSYHIFNFLVHVLTGFCVFLLSERIFKLISSSSNSDKKEIYWKALLVSLIFVLHPIQTMSVTYIIQRMSSLAALFYILSIYFYIIGRTKSIENFRLGIYYFIFAAISGLLAVLSKQNAITLPIMILIVEAFFIRDKNNKAYNKFIISGFSLVVIGIIGVLLLGLLPRENSEITRYDYLITQFTVMLNYLMLWIYPIGQNIDHNILASKSIGIKEILGILVYLGTVTISILTYKKNKVISFSIVWFLVTMLVESSVIPIKDIMVEHRLYLPSFGLSMVVVAIIFHLLQKNYKKYLAPTFVLILLLLSTLTFARNKTWHTWISIWENSIEMNPENPRAYSNLGYGYVVQKNFVGAIKYYNLSLQKNIDYYPTYLNRGIAYFDLKKYNLVISDLTKYIEKYTDRDAPYFFRGVSYGHLGKYTEAISDLSNSIEINPKFPTSYKNRGVIYELTGKYYKALSDFSKSLELDPTNKSLLINRSKTYFRLGFYSKALYDAQDAKMHGISVDPNYISDIKKIILNKENKKDSDNFTTIDN